MADREKVIRGLECCQWDKATRKPCDECPYDKDGKRFCNARLIRDALALIRGQQQAETAEEDDRK